MGRVVLVFQQFPTISVDRDIHAVVVFSEILFPFFNYFDAVIFVVVTVYPLTIMTWVIFVTLIDRYFQLHLVEIALYVSRPYRALLSRTPSLPPPGRPQAKQRKEASVPVPYWSLVSQSSRTVCLVIPRKFIVFQVPILLKYDFSTNPH